MTLIPGVMSRLNTPWHQASWWQWPLALRIPSIVLALAVLIGLGWLSGFFGELGLGQQLVEAFDRLKGVLTFVLDTSETLLGSSAVFWREHGQTILLAAASLLLTTYLTCVAAGTALYRLAWKRTL